MDSYMASNGLSFMFTWIVVKNHFLEAGLTQTGKPWHSERSQPSIYSILSCVRTRVNIEDSLK